MQISNAASTFSQPAKITSFVDRVNTTAAQKLRFSTLLCVAFVTCGWSFRILENSEFIHKKTCGPITSYPVSAQMVEMVLAECTQ